MPVKQLIYDAVVLGHKENKHQVLGERDIYEYAIRLKVTKNLEIWNDIILTPEVIKANMNNAIAYSREMPHRITPISQGASFTPLESS